MTGDRWHVTHDTWHQTHGMWHIVWDEPSFKISQMLTIISKLFLKGYFWSAWQSSSDRRILTKSLKLILWSLISLNKCYLFLCEVRQRYNNQKLRNFWYFPKWFFCTRRGLASVRAAPVRTDAAVIYYHRCHSLNLLPNSFFLKLSSNHLHSQTVRDRERTCSLFTSPTLSSVKGKFFFSFCFLDNKF